MDISKPKAVDVAIIILTITISIVLLSSVLRPYFTGESMKESSAKLIATIISSIISIISMYVGAKIQKNRDEK